VQQRAGKLTGQKSAAPHVCTTVTGLLFVTDQSSKQRFLIDTGPDLCVFPRKLVSQRRERVNYDLCAANGTAFPTYGWLPLSLNLILRREFLWRFVVANVTPLLIWSNFLSLQVSWWTAGIAAYLTASYHCLPRSRPPGR
jgi:hypothetical protein